MREALARILRVRHQTVYGTRPDTDTSAFRRWGFEHGDGWFGLIDALSSVLGMRVAERRLDISVTQIKQKCRTLRWHSGGMDEFCRGADRICRSNVLSPVRTQRATRGCRQ